jgi:hypothetical protein
MRAACTPHSSPQELKMIGPRPRAASATRLWSLFCILLWSAGCSRTAVAGAPFIIRVAGAELEVGADFDDESLGRLGDEVVRCWREGKVGVVDLA